MQRTLEIASSWEFEPALGFGIFKLQLRGRENRKELVGEKASIVIARKCSTSRAHVYQQRHVDSVGPPLFSPPTVLARYLKNKVQSEWSSQETKLRYLVPEMKMHMCYRSSIQSQPHSDSQTKNVA